jgi:hypothetical protein
MLLLKHLLVLTLGLWLSGDKDLSLEVIRAVGPIHPVRSTALGIVVVEMEVNSATGALTTRPLYGERPFASSALSALRQWRFQIPAGAAVGRTSITFLFRPPAFYSSKPMSIAVNAWRPGQESSALPHEVLDSEYPMTSTAEGAVVFAVRIDDIGGVNGIETLVGIDTLTEPARLAIKEWKFSPAIVSGEKVPSTAFVVISFVRPM